MSFADFWTNNNNPSLPKEEYLYGTRHIVVLLITMALCCLLSTLFARKSIRAKNILMYVLAGILTFFEVASRIVNLVVAETYTFASVIKILLPMHICSVMVWMFIIAIFTQKRFLLNFSAIGGLLATLAFLLYPAVGLNRTYMSFTCVYSTVSHMIGFICAYLIIVFRYAKFEMKKIWQPFVCFACMFAWGALLNFAIFPGSNYMYMVDNPVDFGFWGIPFQVVGVFLIGIYTVLFYIISLLITVIKNKRIAKANARVNEKSVNENSTLSK